ncbi:hypothetical protein AB0G55_06760 [Streptomyces toyocaensis]|nr:hypothetical protein [Streptomyces toyocaensis]
MTNSTEPTSQRTKMTLRVYTVNQVCAVVEDHGTIDVPDVREPLPLMEYLYPPCACPRCRVGDAAAS